MSVNNVGGNNTALLQNYQNNPNVDPEMAQVIDSKARELQHMDLNTEGKQQLAQEWTTNKFKEFIDKGDAEGAQKFIKSVQNMAIQSLTMKSIFQSVLEGPPEVFGGSDEGDSWFKASSSTKDIAGMLSDSFTAGPAMGMIYGGDQALNQAFQNAAGQSEPQKLSDFMHKMQMNNKVKP